MKKMMVKYPLIPAWKDIVFIGVMQTLALVPGVSRSGITITAGLLIGLYS
jgi:undecaprenyl-diphosphatase